MKKYALVILSLITLAISSTLVSCGFKDVKVNFKQTEVVLSTLREDLKSVDLDELLEVQEAKKSDVSFAVSNSSLLEIQGRKLVAKNTAYGKGLVYAIYKGNRISSMQVAVKQPFGAPQNVRWVDEGYVTWDSVSMIFEDQQQPTTAETYIVFGTRTLVDENGQKSSSFDLPAQEITDKKYYLTEKGIYDLKISAVGNGYFDDGAVAEKTFYHEFMSPLQISDISFEDGILSWSESTDIDAKYIVNFDNFTSPLLEETTYSLKEILEDPLTAVGEHKVSISVVDCSESENKKLTRKSDIITITKLAKPTVSYNFEQGTIEIASALNVSDFVVNLSAKNGEKKTLSFANNGETISTCFDYQKENISEEVEEGVYSVEFIAMPEEGENGKFYFKSETLDFGKIYKLGKARISGLEGNQEDGEVFKVRAEVASSPVATKFKLSNGQIENGFDISTSGTTKDFEIHVENAGVYTYSLVQLPSSASNFVDEEEVFVVASDESQSETFTKISTFTSVIEHSYKNGKSELSFDSFDDNATAYVLKRFNGESFDVVSTTFEKREDKIVFALEKEVEKLFDAVVGKHIFIVEATTQNPNQTISALSDEKTLTELSAPESVERENFFDHVFAWQAVGGAKYELEIYKLKENPNLQDANTYQPKPEDRIVSETTDELSYSLAEEGYYFARVRAVALEENTNVSSSGYLSQFFHISEKTELGKVEFGFDEALKTQGRDASGYFIRIGKREHVDNYSIKIGEQELAIEESAKVGETETTYLLQESFMEGNFVLKIVGHAVDETIYPETSPYVLNVRRLNQVTFSDLDFDQKTDSFKLNKWEGVTSISITSEDPQIMPEDKGEYMLVDVSKKSDFVLNITLLGTAFSQEDSKTYEINDVAGEKVVYLSNVNPSELQFRRLATPSAFGFYNGDLTFNHSEVASVEKYFVELIAHGDSMQAELTLKFDKSGDPSGKTVSVDTGTDVYDLQVAGEETLFEVNGQNVTVHIEKVFELFEKHSQLAQIYTQSKSIDFSVWGYRNSEREGILELSSFKATTKTDESQTTLNVSKMPETTLNFSYSGSTYTLTWQEVRSSGQSSETEYIIYRKHNGEEEIFSDSDNAPSYSFSSEGYDTSSEYLFYVRATNPNFLSSSDSNVVRVYKLSSLQKITLTNDAELSFSIAKDADFCQSVEVEIKTLNAIQSKPLSFENGVGKITIEEEGEYVFHLKAKTGLETYYVDSDVTSWNVKKMSTLKRGEELKVAFDKNTISWDPFDENLNGLEYVVVFKDKTKSETFKTNKNIVDLQNDMIDDVYIRDIISRLDEGEIEVQVSAHIKSQEIPAQNKNVYFETSTTLLSGESGCNYLIYSNGENPKTITKLPTPFVENVEFEYGGDVIDWEKRQTPDIKVTFTGKNEEDYGQSAVFQVYLNDGKTPLEKNKTISKGDDGKYAFTLTKEEYGAIQPGEKLKVSIYAISLEDSSQTVPAIPSTEGAVTIVCASLLDKVEFVEDEVGFSRKLKLSFDSNNAVQFSGGIVLNVSYTAEDSETHVDHFVTPNIGATDSLEFDLNGQSTENFIDTKLKNGGTLSVSAYADNFSSSADSEVKTFILACPKSVTSETYKVLKMTKDSEVLPFTRTGFGFEIDSSYNEQDTIYVVKYGSFVEKVDKKNDFKFYLPESWNTQGEYVLTIYAVQNTNDEKYIRSKEVSYTLSLNRLEMVKKGDITLKRDPISNLTMGLSWTPIVKAQGYEVRVFHEGELLCSKTLNNEVHDEKIVVQFNELFGENYSILKDKGVNFAEDVPLDIEIITLGNGQDVDNSLTQKISTRIKGNPISFPKSASINDGLLSIRTEANQRYLYHFVDIAGQSLGQKWKQFVATGEMSMLDIFDSTLLERAEPEFELEVVVMADEVSSENVDFALDSIVVSSVDNDEFTLFKMPELVSVGFEDGGDESLTFTLIWNDQTERHLFAGLDKDSVYDSTKRVDLTLENGVAGLETNQYLYQVTLMSILEKFSEGLLKENTSKIYFWSTYGESENGTKYVLSNPYELEFGIISDIGFEDIVKLGAEANKLNKNVKDDFVNTFVLFKNTDTEALDTFGFNVRVTYTAEDGQIYTFNKFISKEQLTSNIYYSDNDQDTPEIKELKKNKFVINLLDIFNDETLLYTIAGEEGEEKGISLASLYGTFKISFSKICLQNNVYSISQWIKTWTDEQGTHEFEFTRLAPINALELWQGNLRWQRGGDDVKEYYVYFYNAISDEELSESDITKLAQYSVQRTTSNQLDASSFALKQTAYYLAVQGINSDKFILSSKIAFKHENVDGSGEILKIYKNSISSKLALEDGTLKIKWQKTESDDNEENIITTLTGAKDLESRATALTTKTYTNPFTFTLSDLVNGNIKFNLRFIPTKGTEGKARLFSIDGLMLLENLFEFAEKEFPGSQVKEVIDQMIYATSSSLTTSDLINKFKTAINNGKYGIGNKQVFFDDIFEQLQAGSYNLQYNLAGNYHTLSSEWLTYDKEIYVNAQSETEVKKIPVKENDGKISLINAYKVVFEKAKIYSVGGEKIDAEKYYVKLGTNRFEIVHGVEEGYVLREADTKEDMPKSVSVYECDASGERNGSTTHLMFYLNYNMEENEADPTHADCLIGKFGDIIPHATVPFEICAVGNDVSISGKSEDFKMTFLTFSNFGMVDGQFVWASQQQKSTSIVLQQATSLEQTELPDEVDGGSETSVFTLDERFGEGLYLYIKFVMFGEVQPLNNVVYVDSEILVAENVYKLAKPELSTVNGQIGISNSDGNLAILGKVKSDTNPFTYRITNDFAITNNNTENSFIDVADMRENKNSTYLYEVGTTWISREDEKFNYKSTEEFAKNYSATTLGSSVAMKGVQDEKTAFNIQKLACITDNGEEFGDVATRSDVSVKLDAEMLDAVQTVEVKDGKLSWNEVSGKTGLTMPKDDGASVVYRVTIERYIMSGTNGGNPTSVDDPAQQFFYTTDTSFDFNNLVEDENDKEGLILKATVQAFAMTVSDTGDLKLVDGKYGSGSLKFADSDSFILMGNGSTIDGISRLNAIDKDSIRVDEMGNLTWTFSTSNTEITAENFKENFGFVLTYDEKEFEILFNVEESATKGTFNVTFVDEKGLKEGTYDIAIKTVCGSENNSGKYVDSFARKATITKLPTVKGGDYVFTADYETNTETMSFEEYFKSNPENILTGTFVINGQSVVVEFNAQTSKLYIFHDDQTQLPDMQNGYVQTEQKIVIRSGDEASVTFVTNKAGALTSYISEPISLERRQWQEESTIAWNSDTGTFTWEDESSEGKVSYYVVEATYGEGAGKTTRIYTTENKFFKPTHIGQVSVKIYIKIDDNSLQSAELEKISGEGVSTDEATGKNYVVYNLFKSGKGTVEEPYIIQSAEEFKNIAYRMSKDSCLNSYVEGGTRKQENSADNIYHFKIENNGNAEIDLGEMEGILFAGTFNGVLDGGESTICVVSTGVTKLTNSVTVRNENNSAKYDTTNSDLVFNFGSALFESVGASARISNLNISIAFGSGEGFTRIANHSLMAGLAINNSGTIENVNVVEFSTNFARIQAGSDRKILAFAGIASVNTITSAIIQNCNINCDSFTIQDVGAQLTFFGGISYINYGKITDCVAGEKGKNIEIQCADFSSIQLAGIAVTNAFGATIDRCTNNFDLHVSAPSDEQGVICYVAGIVCLGKGMDGFENTNTGTLGSTNVSEGNKHIAKDGITAVTTA